MTRQPDFIHVGIPKTASTWLQTGLFGHHPDLQVYGVSDLDTYQRSVKSFLLGLRQGLPTSADDWQAMMQQLPTPSADVCVGLTDENLSGTPLNALAAATIADTVRRLFPGDVKIILILRHPVDYFNSAFYQSVNYGTMVKPIASFFNSDADDRLSKLIKRLNYTALIGHYQALFGQEQILLLPFELLRAREQEFLDRITSFLGVASYPAHALVGQDINRNRRYSKFQYDVLMQVNKLDRIAKRFFESNPRIFNRGAKVLFDKLPLTASGRDPVELGAEHLRTIPELDALLRDEHYALWTGDLAAYNYTFPR